MPRKFGFSRVTSCKITGTLAVVQCTAHSRLPWHTTHAHLTYLGHDTQWVPEAVCAMAASQSIAKKLCNGCADPPHISPRDLEDFASQTTEEEGQQTQSVQQHWRTYRSKARQEATWYPSPNGMKQGDYSSNSHLHTVHSHDFTVFISNVLIYKVKARPWSVPKSLPQGPFGR